MTTTQIYELVNAVNSQAFGSATIAVTDTNSLVSLGTTVLTSSTNTEAFLNVLAQRIGKTIIDFRRYRNRLAGMVLDDFEYGAILQKIKVRMPEAEADESYDLTDGQSVDHYKVAKPNVTQKLFVSRTPYQFRITIQREHLKEAFTGPEQMGSFIGAIFGEVRNAIEISLENLGRACINNFIVNAAGTSREIHLITEYNRETGESLNPNTALHSDSFINFTVARINETFDMMQAMSTLFNDGSVERFTPLEDMRVKVLSKFNRRAQTVSQYAAFHEQLVSVDHDFEVVPFWQSARSPMAIVGTNTEGEETAVPGIMAIVHDRDALGIYKKMEEVATTPVNAAGLYYNQYWHERQLWFNDLSENFVLFTLS